MSNATKESVRENIARSSIIVFDFDGVLTRIGEFAKESAWDELVGIENLLPEERDNRDNFVTALKAARVGLGGGRAGGTRAHILKQALEQSGTPRELIDAKVRYYSGVYGQFANKAIVEGGVADGAQEVLSCLQKEKILYVNSATPYTPLSKLLVQLNLNEFFEGVFGLSDDPDRKTTKDFNLRCILSLKHVSLSYMLFIGDGEGDVKAAEAVQCRFIGFGNDWNKWRNGEKPFPVITSLRELLL